ncbi:DDE-type integrase/transposase/recombinase [Paenibacillus hemerocallicola]|uniref:DDE-type integrase/transposase/recombinase n=1 Tax=Paenibacillus hemerocallicola TaxID=1172614 RepID=A0A5C4SXC1_9BACL|nr:DDE-type integrase/transposase/recombinase [Paenibacillus hemerocallicola]
MLHHSDRGSQYASHDYQEQLKVYSMIGSMSRKGNCYDNACIESFHGIIKKELIYLNKYETRAEAEKSISSTSKFSTIMNAFIRRSATASHLTLNANTTLIR